MIKKRNTQTAVNKLMNLLKKNPFFKMFIEIFGFKLVSKYQGNEDIVETYILVTEKGKIKTKVN